jgi:hypothetical protein
MVCGVTGPPDDVSRLMGKPGIRAKVERDPHVSTFSQTIPDIGYRFDGSDDRPTREFDLSTCPDTDL